MSHLGPPKEAVRKLPVLETIRFANLTVFGNLRALARAAALPFALTLALNFTISSSQTLVEWGSLIRLLSLVPLTLFAVAWHRFVLLGPQRATPALTPRVEQRHLRFFFFVAVLWLIEELPAQGMIQTLEELKTFQEQPPPEIAKGFARDFLMNFALFMVAAFLTLRFSFVLPAVSVDEKYGFRDSWIHTRGQIWRILFGLLLLVLPMAIFFLVIVTLSTAGAGGDPTAPLGLLPTILLQALQYLIMGLSFTFFSSAFRECTGWIPEEGTSPPTLHPDPDSED